MIGSPTAIIKIMGALAPLMGNKEMSDAMIREVVTAFQSMNVTAQALVEIRDRLVSIDEKLALMAGPISYSDINSVLTIPNYTQQVENAIRLGETHNAATE